MILSVFLCTYTCKQPLGTNLDIGGSKFEFLSEKGFEPEGNCAELMTGRLSELQACSHCKLLELGRLSEGAQLQHLLFCVPDVRGLIQAF